MAIPIEKTEPTPGSSKPFYRRWLKWSAWGCVVSLVLMTGLVVLLFVLIAGTTPKSVHFVKDPIPPPDATSDQGNGLDGFDSPYIGHTGSWNGKGGGMFDASKIPKLDEEVSMGLRWTYMCVYWRALEPDGPVDPDREAGALTETPARLKPAQVPS